MLYIPSLPSPRLATTMRIPSTTRLSSLSLARTQRRCLTCYAHQRAAVRLIASRTSPAVPSVKRRWNSTISVEQTQTQSPQEAAVLHGKPAQQKAGASQSQGALAMAPRCSMITHRHLPIRNRINATGTVLQARRVWCSSCRRTPDPDYQEAPEAARRSGHL